MALLEGQDSLSLDELNLAHSGLGRAGVSPHGALEIAVTPLQHYLAGPDVARPCPDSAVLANNFRIEVASAASGARTALSVWLVPALRYRRVTATSRRSICAMPAGICRGLIWSMPGQGPLCVRSSLWISQPTPVASVVH